MYDLIILQPLNEGNIQSTFNVCREWKDVPSDSKFSTAICFVQNKGWMNGYADNTFKPDQKISVAEALKVLFVARNIPVNQAQPGEVWHAPYMRMARVN